MKSINEFDPLYQIDPLLQRKLSETRFASCLRQVWRMIRIGDLTNNGNCCVYSQRALYCSSDSHRDGLANQLLATEIWDLRDNILSLAFMSSIRVLLLLAFYDSWITKYSIMLGHCVEILMRMFFFRRRMSFPFAATMNHSRETTIALKSIKGCWKNAL